MKTEIELKLRLEQVNELKNSLDDNDAKYGNVLFDEYLKVVCEKEMIEMLIYHMRSMGNLEELRMNIYKKVIDWYIGIT